MTKLNMERRDFIQILGLGTASLMLPTLLSSCGEQFKGPSYLKDYQKLYKTDPKQANLEWFKDAKSGLFLHYGLYSLLGQGEWVQYGNKIHVAEYEKLKSRFTAEDFDADFITDLALKAGMKYINITTRHHDSFCLFNTKTTNFNSVNSPAKRDLVEELANACDKKGLGLFLYFSHGRDWRHPHAPNNDIWGGNARPAYAEIEPNYKYGDEHDLNIYIDYMHEQLKELLTNYGSIAGIWLDGSGVPDSGPTENFRMEETYALIRKLQPQTLISYKQGFLGTEDFYAPEIHWLKNRPEKTKSMLENRKPIEICTHIAGWGYRKNNDGKHRGMDSVLKDLRFAKSFSNSNLLLNIAPKPSGTIDKQDIETLEKVGSYIKENGWPT